MRVTKIMSKFNNFVGHNDMEGAYNFAKAHRHKSIPNIDFVLSIMYHNGDGVKQDYYKEVHHLEKAARHGYEPAMFHLAMSLGVGSGIEQDADLGLMMMNLLIDSGYEPAIKMMEGNSTDYSTEPNIVMGSDEIAF